MIAGTLQSGFAAELLGDAWRAPSGLVTWNGSDPARRFGVHRNNVMVSLIDALATRFPVVRTLVGQDFFEAMAREFAQRNPPRSPVMSTYGEAFPHFIAQFAPAARVPYLADMASLEAARTTAYHAADAPALGPAEVGAIASRELESLTVRLHPSVRMLVSRYAIVSLWGAHQDHFDIAAVDPMQPESAIVARPEWDVEVTRLPPGATLLLQHFGAGEQFGAAVSMTIATIPTFDLTEALRVILAARVISSLSTTDGEAS